MKDITKAVNRGINGSSCMYTEVKNRTLAAINTTVLIRRRPLVSSITLSDNGADGDKKKSHVRMTILFSNTTNRSVGMMNMRKHIRAVPAFTGCHIFCGKSRE